MININEKAIETNKKVIKNGIYIYDDLIQESNIDQIYDKSLCYLYFSLGSQKFQENNKKNRQFDFFLKIIRVNLEKDEIYTIGEEKIFPVNYCTPFEKNYTMVYFNFDSIDNIRNYFKRNELKILLNFSLENGSLKTLFEDKLNSMFKPVTNIERQEILVESNRKFKIKLNIKVEWYAVIPKKFPEYKTNLILKKRKSSKLEEKKNVHFDFLKAYNKQAVICSAINLPNDIYYIYENCIYNDPLIKLKTKSSETKNDLRINEDLMNKTEQDANLIKESEFYSNNEKMGFWSIKMKELVLKEKGFIQIYDRFPKYRQSKNFKVFFQHCIQDENKKFLTPLRGHWSILTPKKLSSKDSKLEIIFPNDGFYIANLNIYSRIPEVITGDVNNKHLFIRCALPTSSRFNEKELNDSDVLFIGKLSLKQVLKKKLLIKLYNPLSLNFCIGYLFMEINNIKEYKLICVEKNKNNEMKYSNSESLMKKQKISISEYLEQISLIFIYIYWHIKSRSKVENEDPNKLILEFYSRLVSISDCEYVNITGIVKCIHALIPSDHFYLKYLMNSTLKISPEVNLLKNAQELIDCLLFPHLKIFESIYKTIFSHNSADTIFEADFVSKCIELGVRESISIVWNDMIRDKSGKISIRACKMCIKNYKTENIFNKVLHVKY